MSGASRDVAELDEVRGLTDDCIEARLAGLHDEIGKLQGAVEMLELLAQLTLPERREMYELAVDLHKDQGTATHRGSRSTH